MVIGSITETQKLIDDSLKLEQEGVELNMCKILEELEERGREKGRIEGRVCLLYTSLGCKVCTYPNCGFGKGW